METINSINKGKTLLVYYSLTGNTRFVAERLAKRLGADTDDLGSNNAPYHDPSKYNLVIIGTPIHALSVSRPVKGYLRQNRGKFNEVAVFVTYHLWNAGILDRLLPLFERKPCALANFKSGSLRSSRGVADIDLFADSLMNRGILAVTSYD